MNVDKLLLWEKYRPKTLDDIILPDRIKKNFKDGLNDNYIFYGHYGTGKTSLARILIGEYTKDKPYIEINSSLYTSIDVLRGEIDNFCKTKPMMEANSDIKYVFLDEFDRVSIQFQDAFKAFIEKYSKNGVRFIITTNHINKISGGIKSRIDQINFDTTDKKEEKELKKGIYKKIVNDILPKEKKEIPKEELISIIKKNYPDFRSTIVGVQNYIKTGDISGSPNNLSNTIKLDLYNLLYDKNKTYEEVYHFLMDNFGDEKIHLMIDMLSKPFIDWSIENNKDIDKMFKLNYIISDYKDKINTSIDPIVLGMTVIGKFREIIQN